VNAEGRFWATVSKEGKEYAKGDERTTRRQAYWRQVLERGMVRLGDVNRGSKRTGGRELHHMWLSSSLLSTDSSLPILEKTHRFAHRLFMRSITEL
jgi:hypothetical protein